MASERADWTLHLELKSPEGETLGNLEARFSLAALRAKLGALPAEALAKEQPSEEQQFAGPSANGHDAESTTRADIRPRPFHGRDDAPLDARGDTRAMSTEQRKFLFRLAYSLGFKRDAAANRVLQALGVSQFEQATRAMASQAIDALKVETEERAALRSNGSNGASRHG